MLKNREEIAKMFRDKGFKVGAEIGVFAGYFSEVLCKTIPGLKLYCIDSWEVYSGYRDYKFESSMKKAYDAAVERLKPYDCEIIKNFSVHAARNFEDFSLDFVYIDANHEYSYVYNDLMSWTGKVKEHGGIVAGDDYYMTKTGNFGVIQAVHEFTEKYGYELHITPWDLKAESEDNRQPQWWFERP